jgi:hypothetical protein
VACTRLQASATFSSGRWPAREGRVCRCQLHGLPRNGEQGVSQSGLYPTLAGMDEAVIYYNMQLDPLGKAAVGRAAMACRLSGESASSRGHTLRESDPAVRLYRRSGTWHPALYRLSWSGRPEDRRAAIEDATAGLYRASACGFARGFRQNNMNEQMRTIASQLTPDEMHLIAEFYGVGASVAQVV